MKQVFMFVETSVKTWYDDEEKAEGKVTHARAITGYNSTGIFFHDPWDGPNIFWNYSPFSTLWDTDSEYWGLSYCENRDSI